MLKKITLLSLFLLSIIFSSSAQHIEILQQGKPTSIRGLSVVDDQTAWISGSKGHIAITTDGGKNWNWQQVKGYEKADFRDIEAFSDKEAIIMSSGTPALILKTTDGGVTWREKYRQTDSAYFLDAMDFADRKHGYVLGDPIKNKFLLLETKDGGETWAPFKNPPDALPGEAAFAASGTCLRVSKNILSIVTGGSHSRELDWVNDNLKPQYWMVSNLPFPSKKPSQGAFSFAAGVYVGGDYSDNKRTDSVACYLEINYASVAKFPEKGPAGYQSCVEYIFGKTYLSTGTPGSNITTDGGKTWSQIDGTSYNVCRKAKNGKLVLLAGDGGKIGILKL